MGKQTQQLPAFVGPTALGVAVSMLEVVCKWMQQLPAILVHHARSITQSYCFADSLQGNHVWCRNILLRFKGDHGTNEMLGAVSSKVLPVWNFAQQLPTICNNIQQGKAVL